MILASFTRIIKVHYNLVMDEDFNFIIKLVLLGDSSVGKTNLLLRYAKNEFHDSTKATIGMDFLSLESQINGSDVRVQFWDTAG